MCWKLFSKEAKASKQGPRNPSTAPQRIPLHLEIHKGLDHGFCLHMGDGPHHHCCGESKICGGESTVNNPGCPCHHIPTFQVGLVTMLVVLIPAACMICYHSYVRFQQQIPVLLNNMSRNFNMHFNENFSIGNWFPIQKLLNKCVRSSDSEFIQWSLICLCLCLCLCRSGQMGDKDGEDLGSLVFVAPLRDPELGCRMCR